MKSIKYPFSGIDKDYPNGSVIIKQTIDDSVTIIEYDLEMIIHGLKGNDPTNLLDNLPKISKEELNSLISLITKNIVEISIN